MKIIRHVACVGFLLFTTISAAQDKPNILVIWGDDIGYFNVGAYNRGAMGYMTPNIDRFAEQGCVCTNAISPLPVCGPYRGSLLTGRTPTSTGLVINDMPLRTTEVSIAHCFKADGYDTAYIGKWHLGPKPDPETRPPGSSEPGMPR